MFAVVTPLTDVAVRVPPLIEVASAAPKVGVTRVGELAKTRAPVPVSSEMTPASCAEVVEAKSPRLLERVASVPDVGRVRIVAPVVLRVIELAPVVMKASPKVTFLVAPAAIDNVSPPPNKIELVFNVVLSFTVRVLPAPRVNVPELAEIVLPLIEVARAAPKVGVTKVGELL